MIGKIFSNKHFWPVVIVLIFGVLAARHLFTSGYFNMHDDLQMLRQLEMEKCFQDGQIPCRWTPDMAYQYGFAMFNFYPPLPYLVGEIFRVLGFTFVNTAKNLFIIAFLASGVSMYLLAKEFFGRFGGIVAAVFYIWAPYHSVDIFVRGAMNEAWALIWFPLIAWSSYRLIIEKKKNLLWIITLALSWFGLLTSHNLMVMIYVPFFAAWLLLWVIKYKAWKKIPKLAISGLWALGFAAFFTIPALIENKYTQIDQALVGYYDYTAHFTNLQQIFLSRFWGYGPSVWTMTEDKMSFQTGHIHWVVSLLILAWVGIKIYKDKKLKPKYLAIILIGLTGWVAAFMTHARSAFVYRLIPPFGYVQFPWRFLALSIFGMSFAVGAISILLNKKWRRVISIILMVGLVAINWTYFRPEYGQMGPLTDEEKFSGKAWENQITAGIYDYLPNTAKTAPKSKKIDVAEFVESEGKIIKADQGTNWVTVSADAEEDNARLRINTLMFPGWKIYVDGQETEVIIPEDEEWGRINIYLSQGTHQIEARFQNTPVRTVADYTSLIAWGALAVTPIIKKKKK